MNNISAVEEVCAFLKNAGVYYLATVEDGAPRVRPFGTVNLYDGKLYIQTGKKKSVADQLKANGRVEISAMVGDCWIRLAATAVLDPDIEAQRSMLAAYPSLAALYTPGDGNTEVYYLTDAKADICSFSAPERTITFE